MKTISVPLVEDPQPCAAGLTGEGVTALDGPQQYQAQQPAQNASKYSCDQ